MYGMGADIYYYDDMGIRRDLPFDFTEFGAAVIDDLWGNVDAGICIDDAVERLMDEIDYWRSKLALVDNGFKKVAADAMEHPLEDDYEYELSLLVRNRQAAQDAVEALEEDLSMLLGRSVLDE